MSEKLKLEYDLFIEEWWPTHYYMLLGWPKKKAPRFEVERGDINESDWADADFIYCNSMCFD